MFFNSTNPALLVFLLFSFFNSFPGVIRGKILDKKTEKALPAATLQLPHANFQRTTSVHLDRFDTFRNIPRGSYTLKVKFIGYAQVTEQAVTVGASEKDIAIQNLELREEGKELESIQITGTGKESDRAARGLEKN